MKKIFLLLIITITLFGKYLTNESCKECHEAIYNEFEISYHSKTYFNDELHRKVSKKVDKKKYECAICHMPAADNLKDLMDGKARPDKNNVTHSDAVSCYYCHQIAIVQKKHKYNINQLTRQAEGYKPTLFGTLKDPDETDKHSSVKSPIYTKYACIGCHSHKRNDQNVIIFNAFDDNQTSQSCIKCHMPVVNGKVEDMNKKSRTKHHSHKFLGIHDASMREKSVDIEIGAISKSDLVKITLKNKMPHPFIIQASRLKYIKITLIRDSKVIWQNFKDDPYEDEQGSFSTEFVAGNNKSVSIPAFALKRGKVNNIDSDGIKVLKYKTPKLKKGDKIEVGVYVILAKKSCAGELGLNDVKLTKPLLMKKCNFIVVK